eukprot:202344_1
MSFQMKVTLKWILILLMTIIIIHATWMTYHSISSTKISLHNQHFSHTFFMLYSTNTKMNSIQRDNLPTHNNTNRPIIQNMLNELIKLPYKVKTEEGGWLDVDKYINKQSAFYKSRTQYINITEKLNNPTTKNKMLPYNFTKDIEINSKWNKKSITKLLTKQTELFLKWNIIPYKSTLNYDLQQLEYDILYWIIHTQNPSQCPSNYYEITISNKCGFACKISDYLLMYAKAAMMRDIIFDFNGFGENITASLHEYGAWNSFFEPLSNLLIVCNNTQRVYLMHNAVTIHPTTLGYWLPKQFEERLKFLHNDPVLFFHGVIDRYLLRLNTKYRKQFDAIRNEIDAKIKFINMPKIGCHVRRKDKVLEAYIYEWSNYMNLMDYIAMYYMRNITVRVKRLRDVYLFLATDDKDIVFEAIRKNETRYLRLNYLFNKYSIDINMSKVENRFRNGIKKNVDDRNGKRFYGELDRILMNRKRDKKQFKYGIKMKENDNGENGIIMNQRRSYNALRSIVFDVLLLVNMDYFIGQDASRIGRVILEMMATRMPDYKQRLISIDSVTNNVIDFPYWISDVWLD